MADREQRFAKSCDAADDKNQLIRSSALQDTINTRKNTSRGGSKSDRIDARKLSEQLYMWVPVPRGCALVSHRGTIVSGSDSRRRQVPDKLEFQRTLIVGVTKGCSAGFPRAPQTHLVFHSWRSFHHDSRDRAAIRLNLPAGSLSDVFRILPDAGFLSEIPRMDSVEAWEQPQTYQILD
jgi:hypothetical protein